MEPENENEEPEDPRIGLAELERDDPEVETGPDWRHWHYPDPHWGRDEP